ncbi:MAG TPA: SMP-30/gluconolactonase/LRE family protein [Terriglobales bacterium]|nr:SMP-30/gluconolactonase/LRE family protein [Terriglobales bacterium]
MKTGLRQKHSSGKQGPIEVVADYGNLCGEGPLWDDQKQILYWTDIDGKKFYRLLWKEHRHELVHDGFQVNGACLQQNGGFLVTNSSGVWLWSPPSKPMLLASEAEGQECVLNDCIADPEGRVYSGSYHYIPGGVAAPSFLFRIDNDGSVHIADEGIQFSNGLAFSPDCGTLYFSDSVARCIYAYQWHRETGSLSNRRVFIRLPREQGFPDGLTVDAEGFIWCAHWFGACITRYDPDGKLERRIAIPATQTSSLAFGGPDLNVIFVTSASLNNMLEEAPPGYDPNRVFVGGRLYQMSSDVQGRKEYRSRIRAHADSKPL